MKLRFVIGSIITSGLLAQALGASAINQHIVAGSECSAASPNAQYTKADLTYTANAQHYLQCPIFRDNINSTAGLDVRVYGHAAQYAPVGGCSVRSQDAGGGGVFFQFLNLPGFNVPAGSRYTDFTGVHNGWPGGVYTLECSLNANTWINQVNWTER